MKAFIKTDCLGAFLKVWPHNVWLLNTEIQFLKQTVRAQRHNFSVQTCWVTRLFLFLLTLDTCAAVVPLVPRKIMASADEMLKGEMKMFPVGLFSFKVRKRSTANRVFAVLSCSMVKATIQNRGGSCPLTTPAS